MLRGRVLALWLGALFALPVALPPAAVAEIQTEETYIFWSFWLAEDGQWTYATTGAGTAPATDGSVSGWRFTRSDLNETPRVAGDFDAICRGVEAQPGEVRVGLALDFGNASDYAPGTQVPLPTGECVSVPEGSTMATVLLERHTVRDNGGFVCAIDELPAIGCAELLSASAVGATTPNDSDPAATARDDESNLGVRLGGIALIAVVALAALGAWRNRRPGSDQAE